MAYGLGPLRNLEFLDAGLTNRNWRLACDEGEFALKQVQDVDVAKARRSLETLVLLVRSGLPVRAPRRTTEGAVLAEADRFLADEREQVRAAVTGRPA